MKVNLLLNLVLLIKVFKTKKELAFKKKKNCNYLYK